MFINTEKEAQFAARVGERVFGSRKLRHLTGTRVPVRHTHNADPMHAGKLTTALRRKCHQTVTARDLIL